MNTRAIDLMTIKFKYMPAIIASGEAARVADRVHIAPHADLILEMHDTIVRVVAYYSCNDLYILNHGIRPISLTNSNDIIANSFFTN